MEQTPRRRHAWPWALGAGVVALAILCLNLVVADWTLRTGELAQLLRDVTVSERVMSEATEQMGAVIDAAGEDPTPEDTQKVLDEVQAIAATHAIELRAAGQKVIDLRIAPWNRAVWNARAAYVAHNAAWQAFLDAGAVDPQTVFAEHPDIPTTWDAFAVALPLAVPTPDPYRLADQVTTIIVDGSADDSDSGGGTPAALTVASPGGAHVR